jgi:hypothetical protein
LAFAGLRNADIAERIGLGREPSGFEGLGGVLENCLNPNGIKNPNPNR